MVRCGGGGEIFVLLQTTTEIITPGDNWNINKTHWEVTSHTSRANLLDVVIINLYISKTNQEILCHWWRKERGRRWLDLKLFSSSRNLFWSMITGLSICINFELQLLKVQYQSRLVLAVIIWLVSFIHILNYFCESLRNISFQYFGTISQIWRGQSPKRDIEF